MIDKDKMRFYREAMGWTREGYAELSGYSKEYVSMVESGVRSVSEEYKEKMKEILFEHSEEVAERAAAFMEVLKPRKNVS